MITACIYNTIKIEVLENKDVSYYAQLLEEVDTNFGDYASSPDLIKSIWSIIERLQHALQWKKLFKLPGKLNKEINSIEKKFQNLIISADNHVETKKEGKKLAKDKYRLKIRILLERHDISFPLKNI